MSYVITMYGFSSLIKDMYRHGQDIDEFDFAYNTVLFRAIIDIGSTPFQLLLGTVNHNWACVLEMKTGYVTSMDDDNFMKLCRVLNLKPGKGSFTSIDFLKYINVHAPSMCSLKPVQPSHIMPFRKKAIHPSDEPEKTIFRGWNNHKIDKRTARNFDKTELFLGKKVADFCRHNNVSSLWTTPDKAFEKEITYPEGFSLK